MEDRKKEILLGVGLGVVVVFAMILSLWGVIKGPPREAVTLNFECGQCKHRFSMEESAIPEAAYIEGVASRPWPDCPNCNATNSAYQMERCPICEELFYQDPNDVQETRECPECGRNITEWLRQQHRR